jgi:hypothetical protein
VALARERDALDVAGRTVDLKSATVLRAIRREAENIRSALLAHRDEAREVLAAFVSTMRFEPFGQGRDRGYEFHGEGDYGPLLGATFARPRVPSGTPVNRAAVYPRFVSVPRGAGWVPLFPCSVSNTETGFCSSCCARGVYVTVVPMSWCRRCS